MIGQINLIKNSLLKKKSTQSKEEELKKNSKKRGQCLKTELRSIQKI